MFYILPIIVFATLLILLALIKDEQLSKKSKSIILVSAITIVTAVVIYQVIFDNKSANNRELLIHFNQGSNLTCKNITINQKDFNYFAGTNTFLANDNNKSMRGLKISIDDCEIK